jgi:hypothetical protein
MSRNLGALTLLDPSAPAWPVMGVLLHAIKIHGLGVEVNSELYFKPQYYKNGEWSVLGPCRYNPEKTAPRYAVHRRLS